MRVLLVRPVSPNERFGLGPFFRVEPLGLEYLGADLMRRGHQVELVDARFSAPLRRLLPRFRPQAVGISCTHAVDIPAVLEAAARVKAFDPAVLTVVGGHSASVFPQPFEHSSIDGVCTADGELAMGQLLDVVERGGFAQDVPGWLWPSTESAALRRRAAHLSAARNATVGARGVLDEDPEDPFERVPLPARELVHRFRRHYVCVHKQPVWALETARGCPYRCNFCSTWRRHGRAFRYRSVETVCQDLSNAGPNVFVVDDLFFYPPGRSLELARELRRRGIRKEWLLVQSRLDTVARHPEVLEAWRPLARDFDIFFGFEAAANDILASLDKDLTLDATEEGVKVARALRFGVTGNFVVDPDWGEEEFQEMWTMVDRLRLERLGYTILTPLPGTRLYEDMLPRLLDRDYSHYDMHHILFEPKLGRQRFFELFVESWRRNVLSARHSGRKWWRWLGGLGPMQLLTLVRILIRTQRQLDVGTYLEESFPLQLPALPLGRSERGREAAE